MKNIERTGTACTWNPFKTMGPRVAAAAVVVVLIALLAGPATSQPAGPVAAFSFDEGAGTAVGDASGQSHTGTITGAT